jgi:hypothetical protein
MSQSYAERGYGRYARDGMERDGMEKAGGVIVAVLAVVCGILVIAGLIYATGSPARHKTAVLTAGCEPALFILAMPCITQPMVISQYQAVVNPAVKQLTADTAAYRATERHNLVAAEAALKAEVATEQALDTGLAAMTFTPANRARALALITNASSQQNAGPPPAAVTFTPRQTVTADALITAGQALATLTTQQAQSTTLAQLRSFNPRAQAAGAAVQADISLLRKDVTAPLTWNS